jgi:hypothetical protein
MTYLPGDILLIRDYSGQGDLLGNLIMAGERARYGNSDMARWTHSALIVSTDGHIVEALEEGIRLTNISKYAAVETLIVSPSSAVPPLRAFAIAFALAHIDTDYDVLDFVSLAASLLTGWDLSLHSDKRFICSGLVGRATECYTLGGYPYPSEQLMPADLGVAFGALTGEPLPPLDFFGRFLDKFRALAWSINPFRKGLRPT